MYNFNNVFNFSGCCIFLHFFKEAFLKEALTAQPKLECLHCVYDIARLFELLNNSFKESCEQDLPLSF